MIAMASLLPSTSDATLTHSGIPTACEEQVTAR